MLDFWIQPWRSSCLPKACMAKLPKSRLLLMVTSICVSCPIFESLTYLYLAPVVNVEPILQRKVHPLSRLDAVGLFSQSFVRWTRQSGTTYHLSYSRRYFSCSQVYSFLYRLRMPTRASACALFIRSTHSTRVLSRFPMIFLSYKLASIPRALSLILSAYTT